MGESLANEEKKKKRWRSSTSKGWWGGIRVYIIMYNVKTEAVLFIRRKEQQKEREREEKGRDGMGNYMSTLMSTHRVPQSATTGRISYVVWCVITAGWGCCGSAA